MSLSHLFKFFHYVLEFKTDFGSERFKFINQNGVIGIDVTSTGKNNGFRFGFLRILREIEFEKDFILEDLERFIGSFVEEDSSGVENSLC
ncbi:hypothetical protein Tco_1076890 [Tanacetum coccineum]